MKKAMAMVRVLAAVALAAGAMSGHAVTAVAQTRYSIIALDPPGCAASALNELGAVAGGCGPGGSFDTTAFLWQGGMAKSLGKLPKGKYSLAHAVNALGVAVGEGDTGDYRPRPTLYRSGSVLDIDSSVANGRAIYFTGGKAARSS